MYSYTLVIGIGVLTNKYVPSRGTVRVVYILFQGNTTNQFSLPHPEAELSASTGLVLCV